MNYLFEVAIYLFETSCIKMATDLKKGRSRGSRMKEMKKGIA